MALAHHVHLLYNLHAVPPHRVQSNALSRLCRRRIPRTHWMPPLTYTIQEFVSQGKYPSGLLHTVRFRTAALSISSSSKLSGLCLKSRTWASLTRFFMARLRLGLTLVPLFIFTLLGLYASYRYVRCRPQLFDRAIPFGWTSQI